MPTDFCTLFDINYLLRALVLHETLEEHCDDYALHAYCMDVRSRELLERLELPNVFPVGLAELERDDPELLAVKDDRTQVEYCWTATPAICLHALGRREGMESITYLDADLMFYAAPDPLFAELGDDSVMIVPHRYVPEMKAWEETSGIYNVEWLTFRDDARGLETLGWWRDRCLEWCYFRYEDGKMGDQKYLDDWPERFEGVHVLQHVGGGLAPWNVGNYAISARDGRVYVDDVPLVFFHHHSLRLYVGSAPARRLAAGRNGFNASSRTAPIAWRHGYALDESLRTLVWEPYVERVSGALARVRHVEPGFEAGLEDMHRLITRSARARAHAATRRLARGARRRLPAEPAFVTRRRHRDSWKSSDVSSQMLALATEQLRDPESVAPYSAFLDLLSVLVAEFPLPEPASFLDIGCGVGHYSELLDRDFAGRFEYTGADYAETMIETARSTFPGRTFVVADLFDGTLDLDAYDVVLASALVDVLPNFDEALERLLGSRARYVLLHRQRVTEQASYAEVAPGYEGQRTHRSYLNVADLGRLAGAHGRTIARSIDVEGEMRSFILARVGE